MSKFGAALSLMGSLKDVKRVRDAFDDSARTLPVESTFPPDEVRPAPTGARSVLIRITAGGPAADDIFAVLHLPASYASLSLFVLNPQTVIESGMTLAQLTDESGDAITVAIVEDLAGVRIDHVLRLDLRAFAGVVDALGPLAVYSRIGFAADEHEFTEGTNRLDGTTALAFLTADPVDDAGQTRTRNQRALLRALIGAIDVRQLAQVSDLRTRVLDAFVGGSANDPGLSSGEVASLAGEMRGLTRSAVFTLLMPAQSARAANGSVEVQFIRDDLDALRAALSTGTPETTVQALVARGF